MKQTSFTQQLLLMLLMLLIPLGAWAQTTREVKQLQCGKQTIEVASDEVITFYDFMGTSDIASSSSNNSQSLTVFKPVEAGKSIQITFEEIDVVPDMTSGSYPAMMKVYSGTPDDSGITWATKASEVKKDSPLPTGNVLVTRGGTVNSEAYSSSTAETYVSGEADGSLSVGFLYVYAKACKGWVAKVKAITLENMTVTGAGSNYDGVVAVPSFKQNVPLANAFVTATGVMNPDHVTGIHFKMTQNEDAVDPTALKLFKGDTQLTATVEADGDNYKFVLDEALSDGTNTFTIKGDILGTAAVGAKVQVDITKVATTAQTDGISPFEAGTSVAVENPAIVLMSSTPQTVTIGETSYAFYDEGGKDGGIQANTNGQVTFLSGATDKKVMVNFTTNEIWHGTLYNQELRIYAGQEVKTENLIKKLQQGETGIVRSTAEDGSLTVVLFSDASATTAANGWEATVSLFTPQPMTIDELTIEAASTETVCAGDTEQDMLTIDVNTVNTEPAMQVKAMTFNVTNATKAALYFGATKVGEGTVGDGGAVNITLTTPQALVEGSNIFTLKLDISDDVINNQTVTAQLTSVIVTENNAEKTESVTAEAKSRTVKNIILSYKDQGSVTKTVNGSLAFETKPTSEYSTKYESGTDTRTNIFVPKHDGMVCQIDFSSFAVYYASSSYGTKAKFEIYAGQGTTGTKLWELNDNAQQEVGPGTIIRSTAEDGALTVVFSPNASYSSYTLDGWKATVSEYQSKDMEVTAIEATQASTADASIGASDQELLNVNVKTEGNLNPLTMSSMKLNLKGTQANIAKVSVWQGDNKLGEAESSEEVEVTFTEAVTLAEGDNAFVVKADIKSDATENETIDAKVVSVKVADNDVAATAGDPEGSRTLKNQVLMTAGSHGTISLDLGQTTNLYDDCGPEGDGADGVEATITFQPTGDATSLKLTNLGISFSYTAHLYIYEGTEINDEKRLYDLTGSTAKFDPFIVDGPVTIKYVGKGSYTKPNFGITVEGYKKSDVQITAITTEDISVNEVLKGQTDTKMLKVMVEAKGELAPATITAFNITGTDGEAVDNYHIYQTGTANSFSPVDAFNDSYSITNSGTYYFWLTYDVKADAEVGQTATATVTSVVVNENTINVTEPATATITVASGKHGTYTVGATGADYTTIQQAIDDFGSLGIDGPVTLKIKAGEYNEKVRVPYIKGMGSVNTLTIESESGERDVKIYHNNYTTGGYSDDQHKKDYGVITLYQASYVTLKNLEACTTDKAYKAIVMVKDESRHVTIDNCYLHAPICTASSGEDVCLVGHTIIDEENKNNDYLTVKDCLLEGGKMGVSMGGTNYVALPKELGGIIENNTLKNNGQKAIYVMDELGAKIRNNTVIIEASADTKISVGILDMQLRDEYDEATEITGNIFNVAPTTYAAVMNIRQVDAKAEAPMIIANNVINLASLNASYSAFKFNGAKVKNVNVANNTFRMTGTNGGATFWASSKFDESYGVGINVVNNIIQNETDGFCVNIYHDDNIGKINFENNVMSTNGETFYRAGSSSTGDFASFTEKMDAAASGNINKQVTFLSDDILMPANTLDGDLLTAQALSYVTTDVTGATRPSESISIGAYEYAEDQIPVMADGYPQATSITHESAAIVVKADFAGKAFVLVKKATEEAPTFNEVAASELSAVLIKDTEAQVSVTGLTELTEYKAYVFLQSPAGQKATQLSEISFTTQKTPAPAPTVELYADGDGNSETTIDAGETATLTAMMADGEAPYTITWMDTKHNVLKTETLDELPTDVLTLDVTPEAHTDYTLTVTDSRNMEATAQVRVYVNTEETLVADFENLYLKKNNFENGSHLNGSFVSGSFKFDNFYSSEYGGYWGNYGYSNMITTNFDGYILGQWKNAVGGGVNGSENYMVAYPDYYGGKITVMNKAEGDVIRGFYITNDAYTVDAILNGDGISDNGEDAGFGEGDYLKLTITADNGKCMDVYLADYRAENAADRYYLKTWEWIDLTSLGTVKTLSFSFEGTKTGDWGLNTPTYFCMDDLNGQRPETTSEETLNVTDGSLTKALSEVFTAFDTTSGATITYALADALADGVKAEVSITDGNLIITGTEEEEFTIIVKATQAGHTEYVKLPVKVVVADGINAILNNVDVEGFYTLDGQRIVTPQRGVNIVKMKNGTTRKVVVK